MVFLFFGFSHALSMPAKPSDSFTAIHKFQKTRRSALRTAGFAVYLVLLFFIFILHIGGFSMSASLSGGVTRSHTPALVRGMRDGIPIGLGYLAVAFSLASRRETPD